ncbi:hypothetical protein A3A71_00400 [Candidatus Berkelbacteria bacterium RIFCSPLOWO2_01_FULL_50_28]|uniref:Uncharacterized protein n=1 Tax=Candidatus Berkelbacteria bacterium RIFCSPLOWO2_01_FULL_50_28 TaxID=1797471 RepID=A0A1F5EAT3_9BACT|nr:MAG: hypothetical protein A2807_01155 [Candidatus Berkelbacteria bacterium RIFCSPHIGHO2_01_FULL_50_36]OGD63560.1 MAG: hypothetical protein A3F39_02550 [Candidatus Berkelbacteria bacterium RIFCSPHIGHO2_12_FULL_50_11]OGD64508.1 MAG: hypothetical protein A3A71_00400 [Candidatus Berkelbacteria bacterium RIFCSPLOWO2_01_FULL_50_28]
MEAKQIRVTYGGWYPRTTIHLREIYDFFLSASSGTKLDSDKLKSYRTSLELRETTRQAGNLEYVKAVTEGGIEIRYYEDGLFTLSILGERIANNGQVLESYYRERFSPALNYLFSLGAPTPKVLANIKTVHPTVISLHSRQSERATEDFVSEHIYESVHAEGVDLYKTEHFFLIVGDKSEELLRELVEMQIFFREFKDQLERYLNIHREIWEEIETIKEQKYFRGQDIESIRSRLDNYQKTINLISSRIKQMGSYVETRKSIAAEVKIEQTLSLLFQYKFEVLLNTLNYIEEIWEMTDNYLTSALEVMNDVQAQSTKSSIDSLRTITTVGVISGLIGYIASTELPRLTAVGVKYLLILLLLTIVLNGLMLYINRRRKYQVAITSTELKL